MKDVNKSDPALEEQALLSRLSHRPDHILNAMITMTASPKPSRPWRPEHVSSVGTIERFSPEIISIVLGMLDARSIAHFARTSWQATRIVDSQPAYKDLTQLVSHVLLALRELRLISLHSLAELHAVLRSERCASCSEYGAFLFLPTCQRCCWRCLYDDASLRLISLSETRQFFGLSEKHHLQRLPGVYVIPGEYGLTHRAAPKYRKIVSVHAARELGLEVYGSMERLHDGMIRRNSGLAHRNKGRYLQAVPQSHRPLLLSEQLNTPTNNYFGMGSIPFPTMSRSREVEEGLWCRGCELTKALYSSLRLPAHVLMDIVPREQNPMLTLLNSERRAWSKASFLVHIRHCYGAQQLLKEKPTAGSEQG